MAEHKLAVSSEGGARSGAPAANGKVGASVQALIDRLKMDGIAAGRAEAEEITRKAKAEADAILNQARKEAEEVKEDARESARREQAAMRDGLQIAARDLVLDLRNELEARLKEEVARLVSAELQDPEYLKKLVLSLTAQTLRETGVKDTEALEIILPERALTFEELKTASGEKPASGKKAKPGADASLTGFVASLAADMFREGVTFSGGTGFSGLKVHLLERDVLVEITEETVTSLLEEHLQPRLRAVMEGVLR